MSDPRSSHDRFGPPTNKAEARARKRQQASQARLDHALELVEQAATAASAGDEALLGRLTTKLDGMAFDDFEQMQPGFMALDISLHEAISDLVPNEDAGFGQTWVDRLVGHADSELPVPVTGWVRLALGFAAEEYHLSSPELEAIERARGDLSPDRDDRLVKYLAGRDQRPTAEHLRDGLRALAWLRDHA